MLHERHGLLHRRPRLSRRATRAGAWPAATSPGMALGSPTTFEMRSGFGEGVRGGVDGERSADLRARRPPALSIALLVGLHQHPRHQRPPDRRPGRAGVQ
jgi:hypothetical protein